VLYYILLASITSETPSTSFSVRFFLQLSLGGALFGVCVGWIFSRWLKKMFNDFVIETCLTLVAAYLVFWIAEYSHLFHVSGVISVVFLGFTMSRLKTSITPDVERFTSQFWELISFLANTLIFVLAGDIVAGKLFTMSGVTLKDFGFAFALFIWINIVRAISVCSTDISNCLR
jgi:NhaP-type Na+/H+ or K+/H+ antiporter